MTRRYPAYRDSGVDWLGEVPDGWQVVRVDTVCTVINGYPFDSKLFDPALGLPLVRIRDLGATDAEVRYSGEVVESAVISSTDILIGMDGDFNVGRWKGEGPALLNQRVCCLRSDKHQYSRLLEYVLPAGQSRLA